MAIEERIKFLEQNQQLIFQEIEKLKENILPLPDNYKTWYNSLDDNWTFLFNYNVAKKIQTDDWWKQVDYFGRNCKFLPYDELFEKSFNIDIFSCVLRFNKICTLKPLSHINSLKGLNCRDSNVDDLNPIAHLNKIRYLDIHNTKINDITPISHFTDLELLDIQDQFDINKNDLTCFSNLKKLNLRYSNIINIDFVQNFQDLEYINVGYTNLESIKPLIELKKLNTIYMPKTNVPVKDILEFKEAHPSCQITT